jgi:hypothetical protein
MALSCYVSDLRMEIADTDSWPFRQNLKHEEVWLKQLLPQLDPAWAAPGTLSSPGDATLARSGGDAPRPEILTSSLPRHPAHPLAWPLVVLTLQEVMDAPDRHCQLVAEPRSV